MSDGRKLILSLFTGRKKRKAWNKTREKYTVSPILLQELINNFAVCKDCRGTLLLVDDSHDFGN